MPRRPALPFAPALAELNPMLLSEGHAFTDSNWITEVKYDGVRMLAEVGPEGVQLKSRNGAVATAWFPETALALAQLKRRGRIVLDGEIAVLDERQAADFESTLARVRAKRYRPGAPLAHYCVFDLLVEGDRSLMEQPLMERKDRLTRLMKSPPELVFSLAFFEGEGEAAYRSAVEHRLEGVVLKRKTSTYASGERSADWIKCKRPGSAKGWSRIA